MENGKLADKYIDNSTRPPAINKEARSELLDRTRENFEKITGLGYTPGSTVSTMLECYSKSLRDAVYSCIAMDERNTKSENE